MPGEMDGYLFVRANGYCDVEFAGCTRARDVSEAEGERILRSLADGRALWRVPESGGYEPLVK